MEQRVVKLSQQGRTIAEMARQLTEEGFRSPQSARVLPSTVVAIRFRTGVYQKRKSRPVHVSGHLTITELARQLGIRRSWFLEKIRNGVLRVAKDAHTRCYLFPDKRDTLENLRFCANRN